MICHMLVLSVFDPPDTQRCLGRPVPAQKRRVQKTSVPMVPHHGGSSVATGAGQTFKVFVTPFINIIATSSDCSLD